jgi:hypothetical protein
MKLICEYCGKEDTEYLQMALGKWACWSCYSKYIFREWFIEETINHRCECTCHSCCSLIELGYHKKNGQWLGGRK